MRPFPPSTIVFLCIKISVYLEQQNTLSLHIRFLPPSVITCQRSHHICGSNWLLFVCLMTHTTASFSFLRENSSAESKVPFAIRKQPKNWPLLWAARRTLLLQLLHLSVCLLSVLQEESTLFLFSTTSNKKKLQHLLIVSCCQIYSYTQQPARKVEREMLEQEEEEKYR